MQGMTVFSVVLMMISIARSGDCRIDAPPGRLFLLPEPGQRQQFEPMT